MLGKRSLNFWREFLTNVLRFNLILNAGVAIPIGAVKLASRALTFFLTAAYSLQAICLTPDGLLLNELLLRLALF